MTVVLVHGMPETPAIWRALQQILDGEAVAVGPPGFGTTRLPGFSATKDAYAEWLGAALGRADEPVDVVGHDLGALLTMRVASAFDVALRSWTVDVADILHPPLPGRNAFATCRRRGSASRSSRPRGRPTPRTRAEQRPA